MREFYNTITEASEAAVRLGISSSHEYSRRYKEDTKLHSLPSTKYSKEWRGWTEFLCRESKVYSTLSEASLAAIRLGITSCREYRCRYSEDPRLPPSPQRLYSSDWVNWYDFFGKKKADYYPTLFEAIRATAKLGIKSKFEYQEIAGKDPRLPSNPEKFYRNEWKDSYYFLGKIKPEFYSTLSEAKAAAFALGIKSQPEYIRRYKEDSKLPATPERTYASEWLSYYDFFNRKKPIRYRTLSEAKEAVKRLNIKGYDEYKARFKEDPFLPSCPDKVYASEWKDYYDYLSKKKCDYYRSIDEAKEACSRLGIKDFNEYKTRYKEDPLLPSTPHKTYSKTWIDAYDFFNKKKRDIYSSLAEASTAAINLGIESSSEYSQRYREDSRLPSAPNDTYSIDWQGWRSFLGKEQSQWYATVAQANKGVVKLGITSFEEYRLRYREDSRLPSSPHNVYKNQWAGMERFLLPRRVSNLLEFKQACLVLGIRNSSQYRVTQKNYPQLPSKPEKKILDWSNWYDALDIPRPYEYDELVALVRKNGVSSLVEYAKLRAESSDPRMPVKPEEYYQGKGWTNTYDFWGVRRPYQVKYFTDKWSLWAEMIKEFLKSARGGDTKAKDLCEFVREYIEPNGLETCPLEFLTRGTTNIQPMLILFEQVPVTRRKKWVFSINEFLDWIIANYLILEDTETGEITHIKGAKNPFSHVNFNGDVAPQVINETDKMALPYQFVKHGREWIFPLDSIEKKLSYRDLAHLHRFSSDWVQIKDSSIIDKSDPDCVFKVENGKNYLWFPAYWTYTYSLMQLPARGMQIVYCDSGEADTELADFKNGKVVWKTNRTKLAGLTNRQSMVSKSGQGEFGVHYTSNKTKFDGSGYTIPFMPIDLAYWLVKLRKWQQKYNPIDEPAKWVDCTRTNLNEVQRKQKGINCFLFREFEEIEPGHFSGRLTDRLAAALFFSAKEDATTATCRGLSYAQAIAELKDKAQIALSHFKSPYTPHSMRVSLINAYAYEFGIPLEVIMKLVGHSSIIMTIYYTKSDKNGANLREKMEVGEKEAMSKATQALKSFVEQQRIEEVKSQLLGSSVDLLSTLNNARPASSYLWKDFGICPVGGAFCSEGGCPVAIKANIYHPVPAGYLGEQNCFQCRFFITGPAFLVGLAAMFNEISLAVNTQSIRYTSLEQKIGNIAEKIEVIDHQLYKIKADSSEKFALESDRRELVGQRMHLNSEIETRAKKLDLYLSDMNAIHRHIHKCQTLMRNPKENTENHYQLIVPHELTLDVELDEVSSFHQLSAVCSNAELYHSCSDDLAVTRRSQMIDKMMVENGIQPQLFLLSEEEQLLVGNQLTELMLARLKGWENVDRLMDGSLTLKDLSIDSQFDERTIRELFEQSKPLKRIG